MSSDHFSQHPTPHTTTGLALASRLSFIQFFKRRGLATACFGVSGRRVVMEYLIASIC